MNQTCLKCGKSIDDGDVFCDQCRETFKLFDDVLAKDETIYTCIRCSSSLNDTGVFCEKCRKEEDEKQLVNTSRSCYESTILGFPDTGHVTLLRIILPAKDDSGIYPRPVRSLAAVLRERIDTGDPIEDMGMEIFLTETINTTPVGAQNFIRAARWINQLPLCEGCWGPLVEHLIVCPNCGQKGFQHE